jgi:acyl-CoA thioesterase-1
MEVLIMKQKIEEGSFEEKALEYKWKCTPVEGLPNVLILGDSISIGYTLFVRELLKGKANLYRPIEDEGRRPANCGDTKMGVNNIDNWLGNEKWDVIHFNFGLHDLKRLIPGADPKESDDPSRPPVNFIEEYKQNLDIIVQKLKQTNAKLIFATTTPYPSGVTPCRLPEDAIKYNEAALEIIKKYDIEVNDLYTLTLPKLKDLQIPVNVHFTPEGSEYIAKSVSNVILSYV